MVVTESGGAVSNGGGRWRFPVDLLRARIAGYGVFFATGLLFATLVTRIPALQARFGLSEAALTVLMALVPVVAGVGSMLAGRLVPRFGSAAVLRVAQPLLAAAIVGVGLAPDLVTLYSLNFLVGLCLGAVDATMNMQAVEVERRHGRSLLTGFHAVWSAGAILGSLWAAFTAAPDRGIALGTAFAVVAVCAVAVSAAAGPSLLRARGGAADPGPGGPRLPWRPIALVGVALAFVYVADSAVSTWSAGYVDWVLGAPALAPLAYGCYQATTLLGRAAGDFAIRAFGAPAVVRVGAVAGAAGLLAVVAAVHPWVALAGFAVTGLGASVVIPASFSAAGRIHPGDPDAAVARVNVFNYVGFVLGSVLIGTIAEALDLRAAFAAPMVLLVVVVGLGGRFDPRVRQDRTSLPRK